jgi:hypothetical protein
MSQTNHIHCYTVVIFSNFPALRLQKIIWNLWLTEQLLASQNWLCRVELFSHDARKIFCVERDRSWSSSAGYWVKTQHVIVDAFDRTCSLYGPTLSSSLLFLFPWCTHNHPQLIYDHLTEKTIASIILVTAECICTWFKDGSSGTMQDTKVWTVSVALRDSCNPWYVRNQCFVIGPNETCRQVFCFVVGPDSTGIFRVFRGYDVHCKATRGIDIHVNRS